MANRIVLDNVNALADGNTDFVRDILETFRDETPVMYQQIQEKFAANDLEGTAFYAHKLKSGLRLLELKEATQLANNIEDAAKGKTDTDIAAALVELKAALDGLDEEITEILAKL